MKDYWFSVFKIPATPLKRILLATILLCSTPLLKAQVIVAFQGAEPGDTWAYTTTGLGAAVASECTSPSNIKTGTRSIGVGGTTGGGNCWLGGSGNGTSMAHTITFSSANISTSSAYTRTLSFSWGNRFPVCNGTGWDSGENLTFRAYHNGVAQSQVTIVNGSNNATFSIQSNQYTWTIPPCVTDFYFVVSVTTNRSDELLFVDDVAIKSPALNPVINQPSAILGNTMVCQGSQETYSVTSVPGTSYSWSNLPAGASFQSVNNSVNSHSVTVNWGTAAAGTYSLLVTPSDACGLASATAQTLAVTVLPAPPPLSISGPASLCAGNTITLTSSYASGNTWSTGATTPTLALSAAGVYTLSAQTSCGPLNASYTVSLDPAPNASIMASGPTSFCQGNSVVLNSAMAGGNSWSTGATTSSISVSTSGVYSLSVTTVCGMASSSVQVTVHPSVISPSITLSGPATFCQGGSLLLSSSYTSGNSWSTGATTPTISVNTSGIYTLTVTDVCATATLTQAITVIPTTTAAITASGPLVFCQGGAVILSSGAATGNSWSTGATSPTINVNSPGIYTLTVNGTCGIATAVQGVTVNPLPTAAISYTGAPALCPGASLLLSASGGASYLWSTGQTGNSITVNAAGIYTVQTSNSCGTATSSPVVISALSLPSVQVTGGGTVCQGDSLLLSASGGPGFFWSTGSAASSIYAKQPGIYTVSTANSCGTASASALVDVTAVSANPSAATSAGNAPLPVQFNHSSSSNVTSWLWNFGDGTGSSSSAPQHTFDKAGTYSVTLHVQTVSGCSDTDTLLIVVRSGISSLHVPNVFTPNQDGVNDYFKADAIGLSEFHLSIFDRWGKLVTESEDVSEGWDGRTANGNEAADGTYFYIILAKGVDHTDYKEQGTLSLFR